jgi:hypothetical protein
MAGGVSAAARDYSITEYRLFDPHRSIERGEQPVQDWPRQPGGDPP